VAGCTERHGTPLVVQVCGEMSGQSGRAPTDYGGLDCAVAARLRLMKADGSGSLADRCISLAAAGSDPSARRLSDLFDTGQGAAHPIEVGVAPRVPFWAEVSLYAPGSQPCRDAQPLVAYGRSGRTDLNDSSGAITVPLGVRDACETHGNVQAQLFAIEDVNSAPLPPPSMTLGEIFPYDAFSVTAGACAAAPLSARRGYYRSFATRQTDSNLDGAWVVDHSSMDGCVVIASDANGGRQLSCLSDANASQSTLQGYVLNSDHLGQVVGFNHSVHAQNGALVLRIIDPGDMDDNDSAIGATVNFGLQTTTNGADYPQGDDWSMTAAGGTTSAGLGVAYFANALAGPYVVTFSDDSTTIINAGGADDPDSVTVVVVFRAP